MKGLSIAIILFVVFTVHGQESNSKFSLYLNHGQSIPVGNYRADASSNNPIEIGKAKSFARSFNIGIDFYWNNRIGLTAGFSNYNYNLDNIIFEKVHIDNSTYTDSYLRDNKSGKLYAGLTTRFVYKRLSIEPRISLGLTSFNFQFSDFYLKDSDGNIYKTINYIYETPLFISYNIALNSNYILFKFNKIELGLQFFTEFTYQNPNVKYEKTESNRQTNSVIVTNNEIRQNIMAIYYGIGVIMKY